MSAWTNTYTRKGLALLSKLTQGSSLKITRAVTGTGYVTPSNLANQTAVSGIKQNLAFMAASYPETGVCKLPMFVTNAGIATGYRARQVGIYALDPNEGEILYFIAQSDTGADVPSETEMPEYSATWTFYFRYGQADNVNVTVDPSHTITADMLNEVRVIAETGVSAPNSGAALAKNTAELPFAGLKLFGKTSQNGTPSPDNPVDLTPAGVYAAGGYHHTINILGKNLLREDTIPATTTAQGITCDYEGDGVFHIYGTHSGGATDITLADTLLSIPVGIDTPYTLSAKLISGTPPIKFSMVVSLNSNSVSSINWNSVSCNRDTSVGTVQSATKRPADSLSDAKHMARFWIYNYNGSLAQYVVDIRVQVWIEVGTVSTSHEPYKTIQTLAIDTTDGLNGIPVKSGGNYTDADGQQWICDEIDLARGVYVQRIGQRTLNGTETWSKRPNNNAYIVTLEGFDGGWTDGVAISSHFRCHYHEAYNGTPGYFAIDAKGLSYFASDKTTVDEFKTWLSSNNVTVCCRLATPIETPLTAEEIAAFDALHSNRGVTTIINDGGANMEADCFLAQHEAGFKRIINYVQRYLLAQ